MKTFKTFLKEINESKQSLKDKGFDISKIWYHGSKSGFKGDKFNKELKYWKDEEGFFFFNKKEAASKWSMMNSYSAPTVIPVYLNLGNCYELEFEGKDFPYETGISRLLKTKKMLGYNSIILHNVKEGGVDIIADQAIVFTPEQIISIWDSELKESTISLLDIYDEDELNDTTEALYDFVDKKDHGKEFEIRTMSPSDAKKLKTHINETTVWEAFKTATPKQKAIVKNKMEHFDPDRIIVIANETVLDGNHQLIAAIKLNKPIKYIDVYE